MSDVKHIEYVKQGECRTRSFSDGPLDLMDANLEMIQIGTWPDRIHEQMSHFYLSDDAFYGARFARAKLGGASFQAAWLKNADFSNAKLDGARIEGSSFEETTWRRTDLSRAVFARRGVRLAILRF